MSTTSQTGEQRRERCDGGPTCQPLADFAPGSCGVVCAIEEGAPARRRLLEMGFVAGTPLRVVRLAPLGDPMQVELHGYHISLRRSEARAIRVHSA